MKTAKFPSVPVILAALLFLDVPGAFAAPAVPPAMTIAWRQWFDDPNALEDMLDDAGQRESISGGFFELVNKGKDRNSGTFAVWEFDVDRKKDYALEADMQVRGGGSQSFCGLVWDMKDSSNFYTFIVYSTGSWSIMRMKNGSVSTLAGPESHGAIRKAAGQNRLRVSRVGSSLNFTINGNLVKVLPLEGYYGASSGFLVSGSETLLVDSLTCLLPREYEGERFVRKSGDRTIFETGFSKGADPWILVPGAVEARFDEAGLGAAGYSLEHKDPASYGVLARDFAFDLKKDFSVEARLAKTSKDDDYGYGIAVDRRDDDYLYFRLSGSGFYTIGRRASGRDNPIVDWTPHANVNKYESPNLLGIHRQGAMLYFTLNGRKLFEQEYKAWGSTEAGFVLGGAITVRPESLGVYTY
jgi:hypothetical protein